MSSHDHEHEVPPLPQYLIDEAEAGCEESRLLVNRRNLLGMSAGFFAWAHLPRHAEAAGTEPRLLVVLLRGGMDGLHVAPPVNDPRYVGLRGKIALDKSMLLDLSSPDFRLNPAMPYLHKMFTSGDAALVQAIAPPLRRRSHFEGLYNIESGLPDVGARSTTSGWLNRLLQQLPVGNAVKMDALHIGPTPLILAGGAPVLSWTNVPKFTTSLNDSMPRLYAKTRLAELFDCGLKADQLAMAGTTEASQSADKGIGAVRIAFRGAARMMRAEAGPRIGVLDVGGWDSHVSQTPLLTSKLAELDAGMEDFRVEMGSAWDRTAVVCVTEMGRTVKVNSSDGTDHGDASVAFLLGGAISGKKIWGDWPGLADGDLTDGRSLKATTDMRGVFKGLLADHLEVPTSILDKVVFPDSAKTPAMKDLLKTPAKRDQRDFEPKDVSTTGAGSSFADFRQTYGVG